MVNEERIHDEATRDANGEALRRMLGSLAASRRASLARGAFSMVCAVGLMLLSIVLVLYRVAPGWRPLPLITFVLFWGGLAAALLLKALPHLLPIRSMRWLARIVGAREGRGGLFSSALEFSGPGERLSAYSPYLMDETVKRAVAELRGVRARSIFVEAGKPAWTVAALLLACLFAVQAALQGGATERALAAVADPSIYFRSPTGINLQVVSRDGTILEGEAVAVEAYAFGSAGDAVTLRTSSVPGVWKKLNLDADSAVVGGMDVIAYRHVFEDVHEDFHYYFETERIRTATHGVTVMHRPVINRISAVLTYPSYTRAAPETIGTLAGRITALAGTRVALGGETSKQLREGSLVFLNRDALPLAIAADGFTTAFSISGNDTFTISIKDSMGLDNENVIPYPITSLEDAAPIVRIIAPDDEALLPRSMRISLLYVAADDYGLARVDLRYAREGEEERYSTVSLARPTEEDPLREIDGVHEWSLEGTNVRPGDKIFYYVEAYDANDATGPGYARTETRRLLVPSLSQIYADMRREEEMQKGGMEELLEEGREVRDRMRSLSEDLKADGTFDWSKRQAGREIMERQRELQEKIGEAAKRLDKTLQELESNRMTTQKIGEKMEEIQRLLSRIESVELREAIERFQRMLGEVSEEDMMRAMQDVELDAQELTERLDRTIELLEQVLREEKMEELMRRMEEMLDEQRALRDSTASGGGEGLCEKQDNLGDEAKRFEEDLSAFSEEQPDTSLQSQMKDIAGRMRDPNLEEAMRKASGEIEQGDREKAACTQSGAMEQMLSLYTSLGRCQMCMSRAIEHEVIEAVERLTRELVTASKLEEELIPRIDAGDVERDRGDLISRQLVLKQAARKIVDDLYQLARRSIMISGAVFKHLGGALTEIDRVLDDIEQKKFGNAAVAAGKAFRGMNLAAVELLRANSSSGGSSGNARDQMQMMLQRQMTIDQQLRQMFNRGDPRGWSMEERAGMARIAAEQRGMGELLEQIAEESAGSGEILGRLDDVAEEMDEVAKRLDEGGLDNELLDREERILSRMLESQRSMQRRDYRRERLSTTAGDLHAVDPGSLEASGDDVDVILEMIRRGMREKGPEEYEELIRMYFRALSKRVREEGM